MEGLLRIYSHPAMKHLAGAEKQCFPTDFFFHKFDPKRRWRWLWVRFCSLFFLKPNPFQCPPVPKHLIQWYSMIWLKSDSWSSKKSSRIPPRPPSFWYKRPIIRMWRIWQSLQFFQAPLHFGIGATWGGPSPCSLRSGFGSWNQFFSPFFYQVPSGKLT